MQTAVTVQTTSSFLPRVSVHKSLLLLLYYFIRLDMYWIISSFTIGRSISLLVCYLLTNVWKHTALSLLTLAPAFCQSNIFNIICKVFRFSIFKSIYFQSANCLSLLIERKVRNNWQSRTQQQHFNKHNSVEQPRVPDWRRSGSI